MGGIYRVHMLAARQGHQDRPKPTTRARCRVQGTGGRRGSKRHRDTREHIYRGSSKARGIEIAQLRQGVEAAEQLAGSSRPVNGGGSPNPSNLQKAEASHKALRRRHDLLWEFYDKTRSYRETKKDIRHRRALVQSLMELAPQIWDEEQEKQRQMAMKGGRVMTGSSRKRGRHEDDQEPPAEPGAKRRRGDTAIMTNRQRNQEEQPITRAVVEAVDPQPRRKSWYSRAVAGRARGEWMACLRKGPREQRKQPTAQVRSQRRSPAKPEKPSQHRNHRKNR